MQLSKVVEVFIIVLAPVALGMRVRRRAPGFAARMDKPVRIGSAMILAILIVGLIATVFYSLSLVIGYLVPKALGVPEGQSIASSMEIGVHNGTLAIYVAVEVFDNTEISIPAAVYSLLRFFLAAAWGWSITRRRTRTAPSQVN